MNFNKKTKYKIIINSVMILLLMILKIFNIFNFVLFKFPILLLLLCLSLLLTIAFYATNNYKKEKFLNLTIEYFSVFIYAFFFMHLIFNFFVFPAVVNQTSMNPTLFEGNRILVVNGRKDISRFDIVVIKIDMNKQTSINEFQHDQLWVKRVIGLPGEHIKYENGQLYVNNQIVHEPYLYDEHGEYHDGYYHDPSEGNKYYNSYTNDFNIEDVLLITKNLSVDEVAAGVIPQDYYLLLGDNRATSWDSRRIGLVHKSQLIGEGKYLIDNLFDWKKLGG